MGMYADYMAVSDSELDSMMELSEEKLIKRIEELESLDETDICSLDKYWDGMHFLLTGKSAQDPIDDDELSAAVVGVHNFETDESFIACIEVGELEDVVKEMEKIDLNTFWEKRKLSSFRKKKIYPDIWKDEDEEELKAEMADAFNDLLEFYQSSLKNGMNIIISIY